MCRVFLLFIFIVCPVEALETQILNKGKVLFETDFSGATKIAKPRFWIEQNTRWKVEDGQVVGIPATLDYQEEKRKIDKGHLGDIPRIGLGKMLRSYVMNFKFQMDDKKGDGKTPMFEFGHHVSRIFFGDSGAQMLTDTDNKKTRKLHMEVKGFKVEPFKWYEVLGEVGEEYLFVQIKDEQGNISKFHCYNPKFKTSSNNSFQIASTVQGTLKMDDITFWESKGLKEGWEKLVK